MKKAPIARSLFRGKNPGSALFASRMNLRDDLRSHPAERDSIIGPTGLNFRVRDGNGCDPRGMATRKFVSSGAVVIRSDCKGFSLPFNIQPFNSSTGDAIATVL
jgi:hypothetical protein